MPVWRPPMAVAYFHAEEQKGELSSRPVHNASYPRQLRFTRSSEFQQVYRGGKAFHGRCFVLICRESSHVQVGVVASKKVGNAVVRNRMKRLMREAFRLNRVAFQRNAAIVIAARPPAAQVAGADAIDEITQLFRKASLLD